MLMGIWSVGPTRGCTSFSRHVRFPPNEHSPASRRGRDKRGFHRRSTNPLHFVIHCSKCAHFTAISCNMFSYVATFCIHFPVTIHYGESRHFCEDPVCPDNPSGSCQNITAEVFPMPHDFIVGRPGLNSRNSSLSMSWAPSGTRELPGRPDMAAIS